MLKNLRKKFGEIMKIVFGRNSATRRIIAVEIIVLIISIRRSESITGDNTGLNRPVKTSPYITERNYCQ